MPITQQQREAAERRQQQAAEEEARFVRLVAGPGTGKSKTIEKRVAAVLEADTPGERVVVISFTRATCRELQERIAAFCEGEPIEEEARGVRVSTMHALALRLLRRGNLLGQFYPSDPAVMDDWESRNIYDQEFARSHGCPPGRAAEIRRAYDARWQTLEPATLDQAAITQAERNAFTAFHAARSNLYSCVLPGELIFKCVLALENADIAPEDLPPIDQLIVDEFQDLNACDQRFVELLVAQGTTLFIAGDDDQSIYSFRHADPQGIVHFDQRYEGCSTHTLTDCFRCAPAILEPALRMIAVNPNRLEKPMVALYGNAEPPVRGHLHIWQFADPETEARAIAESCRALIECGMAGRENEIVILISDRQLQLQPITEALALLGLEFDDPAGAALNADATLRTVYSILRICQGQSTERPDYLAHRALLSNMNGIGMGTQMGIGDLCIEHRLNYLELFYAQNLPVWLGGRPRMAVERVRALLAGIHDWTLDDTIGERAAQLAELMSTHLFADDGTEAGPWNDLVDGLPPEMTLAEVLELLSASSETDQTAVMRSVANRLQLEGLPAGAAAGRRIRILTMHGAKGLSGRVVFIPSAEQGVMPSFRAVNAAGLLIEARRLFYVSLTRAMAACIVSHSVLREGAAALRLAQRPRIRLARSTFLNEMNVPSVRRNAGLTDEEAAAIVSSINNL
jgi:DNA helicase-2/ATP-dependent DNA helicase PcrA